MRVRTWIWREAQHGCGYGYGYGCACMCLDVRNYMPGCVHEEREGEREREREGYADEETSERE
eukprot:6664468-Pyramimonas_sp.AAC.1